jgi:hypothetical protein
MIRKKKDCIDFERNFETYSSWDGVKYFFTFEKEGGSVTLMKYEDGTITYHRVNESFCDIKEIILVDVYEYLWKNRKYINKTLKISYAPIEHTSHSVYSIDAYKKEVN